MGLDSVELIVEWEKFFKIDIPNLVAEEIRTVQNAVDSISAILNIVDDQPLLRSKIFSRLQEAISKSALTNVQINQSDRVCKIFQGNNHHTWQTISKQLDLEVPFPPPKPADSFKTKIFSTLGWLSDFKYDELSFTQLTDAICGKNYKTLIDAKAIRTKYEIYIALMGLTVHKLGIDPYEVSPNKTFVGDFGIS